MTAARSRLDNRREHDVFEFDHAGVHYTTSVSHYGHGPVGEVFLDAGKAGTAIQTHARDGAIVLSLLLQHGCPIDVIRHAVTRNPDGSAAGPLGTLLDHIAVALVPHDAPDHPSTLISTKSASEQGGSST